MCLGLFPLFKMWSVIRITFLVFVDLCMVTCPMGICSISWPHASMVRVMILCVGRVERT